MTVRTERYLGSDATGSDGGTSRVLTIANIALTSNASFNVSVQGLDLALTTDYTVSHATTGTIITFVNSLFDSQYIIVTYEEALTSGSAVYCSAADVGSFLQVSFSGSTTPSSTEVEAIIAEHEDYIDAETMHAWRTVTVTEETHHVGQIAYQVRDGVSIFLENRSVKTLSSGSGDKVEIWNGSTWEDYLVSRTEGRNNDFWLDYKMGVLFLKTFTQSFPKNFAARITYRFGESTVKADIKKACVYLTAADIVESDDRSVLLPEGTSNVPLSEKARSWRERAEKIIKTNKQVKALVL